LSLLDKSLGQSLNHDILIGVIMTLRIAPGNMQMLLPNLEALLAHQLMIRKCTPIIGSHS
jgi:hypothetical protein